MNGLQMEYRGYRNLQEGGFSPSDGINVIYGKNANGKTNLLDAMWLFTGGRSFRRHRDRHAAPGPVVAGALGIALELDYPVVEPYLAVSETGLAESGRRHHLIDYFPVDQQSGGHPV